MKAFLTILLAGIIGISYAQPKLTTQQITDEISMLVPDELTRTPQAIQRTTSPALAVFNSRDGQVDLGINMAQLRWSANDIDLLSQFYKANILNLYDEVQMHQEGIQEINGRKYIVFEFSGILVDQPTAFSERKQQNDYTYIMYQVNADGVLIFRFTCPQNMMRYWKAPVQEIMQSVAFKESKKKR